MRRHMDLLFSKHELVRHVFEEGVFVPGARACPARCMRLVFIQHFEVAKDAREFLGLGRRRAAQQLARQLLI